MLPGRLFFWLLLFSGLHLFAQDTLQVSNIRPSNSERDSIGQPDSIPWPNPEIAWKLSALLPGAGQIYNKSYWKPPIIYAGLGVFVYLIVDNHNKYKLYRHSYIAKTVGVREDYYPDFSVDAVLAQRNYHRQTRDLCVILGSFWYALNIVEAYVDAHLKHFDVSEKISWSIIPGPIYTPYAQGNIRPGLQARIRF